MALKQIPISLLSLGMFITKLDVSWIDSPFMYHHILIKSQKQIDKLIKAGVKLVTIDTAKGKDISIAKDAKEEGECLKVSGINDTVDIENTKIDSNTDHSIARVSLDKEMGVAKELMSKMTSIISEMNDSLKGGECILSDTVEPFIKETLSSLQRNEHALTALVNMQRKDQSLAKHAFATFSLILSLAIKLKLSNEEKESLGLAAFFHDVGWLKLPLNLLGKKSAYTDNELKLVRQHIAIGCKALSKQCDLSDLVLRVISEHHECMDGSGFPNQLGINEVHPLSKIFSVVVRYDELVHGLTDKPALTPNGALAFLFKESNQGRLDPFAVSSLISLLGVYPVGSCVQLTNKEKALVIETHPDHPKRPKIKVFYDVSGLAHAQAKVVDLAAQANHTLIEISSVLDLHDPKTDPANVFGEL